MNLTVGGVGIIKEGRISLNPLNAELNPIRHLLALAGGHHFVDASRIRVNIFFKCFVSLKFEILRNLTKWPFYPGSWIKRTHTFYVIEREHILKKPANKCKLINLTTYCF
jgi:hypothetical protein